ncbi:MAG: hypothetical protein WAT95_06135 [Gemmiger qucibialis]
MLDNVGLRHGICVAKMLDNVGLRYPHRASGAKAPRTLRPLPLLRFAVSAGAHLCSIQYYLRFWLSSCRTSLAVSALRSGIALSFLSTEITGGFTGCTVGMYASANGTAGTNHAAFYWFAYQQVRNKLRKNMTIKSSSRRRGAAFGL